jgi:glycosyltransferase involved in cell wall biosynthesis
MPARSVRKLSRQAGELNREGALGHPLALLAYLGGRVQRARGSHRRAAAALQQARRRDPGNPVYAAEAGIGLARLGRDAGAEAVVEQLLAEGDEASPDDRARAALVCVALGELRAAREFALAAIAAAPEEWPGRATVALALERAGEPTRALEQARLSGEQEQERRLEGQLRCFDPGWLPELPRPGHSKQPSGRVLYLLESSLPHAPSGYAYRSDELLRALGEIGLDPIAATRLGFPASRGILDSAAVESVDGVPHHRFNVPGLRHYTSLPLDQQLQRNAEQVLKLVQRERPSLIIAASPHLNGVMALALRAATGTPVVYDVRGFPEMTWALQHGGAGSEIYRLRRRIETHCAAEADGVITNSDTMRAELYSRGIPSAKVGVVPQVVDTTAFSPRKRPAELARAHRLQDRFVVGSISSLREYEGVDVLLRAVAATRAHLPELAALVVGEGPAREGLERLAAELGLTDSVVFTGRVDHSRVSDHYALLDLFALPRRDMEVCRTVTPLKPFEALAMGVPVIASELAATVELADATSAVRLVPPDDPDALGREILALAVDEGTRAELATAAREYALERHGRDVARAAMRSALSGSRS